MATLREDVRNELADHRSGARHHIANYMFPENYHPGGNYYPYLLNGTYGRPHRKQSVSPVRKALNEPSPARRVEVKETIFTENKKQPSPLSGKKDKMVRQSI